MKRVLVIASSLLLGAGCDKPSSQEQRPPAASPSHGRVDVITVDEDVADATVRIRQERERAKGEGRELVVYVGAPWCEPCKRFHDAAAKGELDARFPTLRLIEFDRDRHEGALREAGCLSEMIPLFAKPTADGRCSDKRVEGGIKGEGAVGYLAARLERMMRM